MNYNSTRNAALQVTAAQAIAQGISEEGGLFVPQSFPKADLNDMLGLDYIGRAEYVLSRFLTDFTPEEIKACAESAYGGGKFDDNTPAPVVSLDKHGENKHILELWHGPTCAFKDMALQILPHLLTRSLKKTADGKTAVILVATSGDTGKAALEGFKDVAGTEMIVFYPENGVSPMQKRQMNTQEGENICVCAIHGNFDDAQTGVKKIFTDPALKAELAQHNKMFSSANSINWGRLLPQIVYYFSAYLDLVNAKKIKMGDAINVVVPTGNFGNILAAYYAKRDPRFASFLTEGRTFGPHGEELVVANSVEHYDDVLSAELTHRVVTANLEMRALGFKPFVAPAFSSGALSILLMLRGEWHCGSVYLGGAFMGVKNRYTPYGLETEILPLPEALSARIRAAEEKLKSVI